jgi:hypothetical protein
MNETKIKQLLNQIELGIKNFAQIDYIKAHGGGNSFRDLDVQLSPAETKPIFEMVAEILRSKLAAN